MSINRGKQFETNFRDSWLKTFKNSFIYRIPDQVTGYITTSQNPCDFICFTRGHLFLIECKSHDGWSIPFTAIRQSDRLINYIGLDAVHPGVVIWFKEKDKIIYVPAETLRKMKKDGKKSISLKTDLDKYDILDIPSIKKRTFMTSDFSVLLDYYGDKDE